MRIVMVLISGFLFTTAAGAACFEDIGCTDSQKFKDKALARLNCENLWFTRNTIYDENGYCFNTDRGAASFDNSDCQYSKQNSVPLNSYERYNVKAVKRAEKKKHC